MKKRRKPLAVAPRPQPVAPAPGLDRGPLLERLLALGLVGVTLLVYLPALSCDFVFYDDAEYVTDNGALRLGLSLAGIRWAWTAVVSLNWHPLTLLSLLADYQLYGLKPFGFHLTNVLLHLANTVLLFRVLRLMTGNVGRSAAVALLFALHPLHVESVAWVAERKDVLSTFFGLLALRAYVWYAAGVGNDRINRVTTNVRGDPIYRVMFRPRMALVCVLLALSLLAKPMWVTFPFLLLLLDYWPLRRAAQGLSWRRLVAEKLPLFVLIVASSAVTVFTQTVGTPSHPVRELSLALRLGNAAVSYVEYLRQTLAPLDLAAFYPHPQESLNVPLAVAAAGLLIAVSAAAVWRRQRLPYLFVGWFWYLGSLVPVIGLVQVGLQARADRYTYLPLVGIFLLLSWGAADLFRRARLAGFATGLAVVVGLLCGLYSWAQISHWHDPVTLWRQACNESPDSALAHKNLAGALMTYARDLPEALAEYDRAIRLDPHDPEMYANRGHILIELGERLTDAEHDLKTALSLNPHLAEVHQNLGLLRYREGRLDDAARHFLAARDENPKLAAPWLGLGKVRLEQKHPAQAVEYLNDALRLDPGNLETYDALGRALAATGRYSDAVSVLDDGLARAKAGRDDQVAVRMRDDRALFSAGRANP